MCWCVCVWLLCMGEGVLVSRRVCVYVRACMERVCRCACPAVWESVKLRQNKQSNELLGIMYMLRSFYIASYAISSYACFISNYLSYIITFDIECISSPARSLNNAVNSLGRVPPHELYMKELGGFWYYTYKGSVHRIEFQQIAIYNHVVYQK